MEDVGLGHMDWAGPDTRTGEEPKQQKDAEHACLYPEEEWH